MSSFLSNIFPWMGHREKMLIPVVGGGGENGGGGGGADHSGTAIPGTTITRGTMVTAAHIPQFVPPAALPPAAAAAVEVPPPLPSGPIISMVSSNTTVRPDRKKRGRTPELVVPYQKQTKKRNIIMTTTATATATRSMMSKRLLHANTNKNNNDSSNMTMNDDFDNDCNSNNEEEEEGAEDLQWSSSNTTTNTGNDDIDIDIDIDDDDDNSELVVVAPAVPSDSEQVEEDQQQQQPPRPIKWLRASTTRRAIPIRTVPPIQKLPDDLLLRCLSYVADNTNRYAIQCTSQQFYRLSNTPIMLQTINVWSTNFLTDTDTVESAIDKLEPFATANNLPALYMLGTIRTYCDPHVEQGIALLKAASRSGYVPAHYSLGLVLRDTFPHEADYYMQQAVNAQYFPALQEVLSDAEMKKRTTTTTTTTTSGGGDGVGGSITTTTTTGEVNVDDLLAYMDPSCLSRLLGRHYCLAKRLRTANTSHCWNPKCGRWAFRCSHGGKISHHHHSSSPLLSASSHHHHRRGGGGGGGGGGNTTIQHIVVTVSGVSRMKVCSRCCRAKYCSKLCQVYDWRSGRHQTECQYLM